VKRRPWRVRTTPRTTVAWGILLAAAGWAGNAPAQRAAGPGTDTLFVTPEVGPVVVGVGERISVRVAVARSDTAIRLLGPPAPLQIGVLDILASGPDPAGGDSAAWRLAVALFELGEVELPPLPFRLEGGGETRIVVAAPYTISVVPTVEGDTAAAAGIRDIRGPVEPPVRILWLRVAGALLVLGLLGAGLVMWRGRRRGRLPAVPALPAVPPDVEALGALAALEREALPERGRFKEHYTALSLILRTYVERRWGVPAVESTTHEIDALLERSRTFAPQERGRLRTILDEADLVKFAKFTPTRDAAVAALHAARSWVDEVRPTPAPERIAAGETV